MLRRSQNRSLPRPIGDPSGSKRSESPDPTNPSSSLHALHGRKSILQNKPNPAPQYAIPNTQYDTRLLKNKPNVNIGKLLKTPSHVVSLPNHSRLCAFAGYLISTQLDKLRVLRVLRGKTILQNKANINLGNSEQPALTEEIPPDTHIYVPIRHQNKPNVKMGKKRAPPHIHVPMRHKNKPNFKIGNLQHPVPTEGITPDTHIYVPTRHQNKPNVKMRELAPTPSPSSSRLRPFAGYLTSTQLNHLRALPAYVVSLSNHRGDNNKMQNKANVNIGNLAQAHQESSINYRVSGIRHPSSVVRRLSSAPAPPSYIRRHREHTAEIVD